MRDKSYRLQDTHPTAPVLWMTTGWSPARVINELHAARSVEAVKRLIESLCEAWRAARWLPHDAPIELPEDVWVLVATHSRHLDAILLCKVATFSSASDAYFAQPITSYPFEIRQEATSLAQTATRNFAQSLEASAGLISWARTQLQHEAQAGGFTYHSPLGVELVEQWAISDDAIRERRGALAMVFATLPDTPGEMLVEIVDAMPNGIDWLDESDRVDLLCALVRHPNATDDVWLSLWDDVCTSGHMQQALFGQSRACRSPELQGVIARTLRNAGILVRPDTLVLLLPHAHSALRADCWRQLLNTVDGRALVLRLLDNAPENPVLDLLRSNPEMVLDCSDAEIRQAAVIALSAPRTDRPEPRMEPGTLSGATDDGEVQHRTAPSLS